MVKLLKQLHPSHQWHAQRWAGTISIDWQPLLKLSVYDEAPTDIAIKGEVLTKYALDKAATKKAFEENSTVATATIQWEL